MDCLACGTANRSGRKFCAGCGSHLQLVCPRCGTANEPDEGFCGECGTEIKEAESRNSKVQRPRLVTSPSTSHPSTSSGQAQPESRSDPRSYTPKHLAEQLDPEEWSRIMNRFFQILSDGPSADTSAGGLRSAGGFGTSAAGRRSAGPQAGVERFEGFVDKFTGDGIMALFGASIAHEDHAQRACYAALLLQDELRRYLKEAKALLEELG
jgi:predicted nucleic acid-binding Zn ribbon protein